MKTVAWCWTVLTAVLGVIDYASEKQHVQMGRWDLFFGLSLIFWGIIMAIIVVEYVSFKAQFFKD